METRIEETARTVIKVSIRPHLIPLGRKDEGVLGLGCPYPGAPGDSLYFLSRLIKRERYGRNFVENSTIMITAKTATPMPVRRSPVLIFLTSF